MSRSGYTDECDGWELIRWRGAVNAAIRGKRGQQLLREMADAMDAMPKKVLAADELKSEDGNYCALGTVGAARGLDMIGIEAYDREAVANLFNIAPALAAEIAFINDDEFFHTIDSDPAERWRRVRRWLEQNIEKGEAAQP